MAPRDPQDIYEKILDEIRDNSKASHSDRILVQQKIDDLARKQDSMSGMIDAVRREQANAIDTLRRDFERLFVSRAEYDPKHQVVIDKIREYDGIIRDSQSKMGEYYDLKNTVKQLGNDHVELRTDFEKYKEHRESTFSRVYPWILTFFTLISLIITVLTYLSQHAVFH